MCNRKVLSVKILFFGVFLFLAAPYCFAQSNYQKIETYRSQESNKNYNNKYDKTLELTNGQNRLRQPTGYPDLDMYYSQLEKNTHDTILAHERYLLETTPIDSLIIAFVERGYDTYRDPANLHLLFNPWHTTLTFEERGALLDYVYVASRKHKSKRLELLADIQKGYFMPLSNEQEWNAIEEHYESAIHKACNSGNPEIEAEALEWMWFNSFYGNRYARAFAYARRLEKALERIGDDYPRNSRAHFHIGKAYYTFKDYDRALIHLHKTQLAEGWNHLAAYHKIDGNIDSATYYHRKILSDSDERTDHPVQLAIAISNLGRIELEKGNIGVATAMLEAGLDYMTKYQPSDPGFISGQHVSLGEAYLAKGDMTAAWKHIAAAQSLPELIGYNMHGRLKALFALKSSYYARLGQNDLARSYLDSALVASTKYEQNAGKHIILLGEQQLQEVEAQLKDQHIARQRNIILSVIGALILISVALMVIIRLYRKRNAAYKVLARKAEAWAREVKRIELSLHTEHAKENIINKSSESGTNGSTTDQDHRIMALVEQEMSVRHIYRNTELTAEMLADRLGIHRNVLSHAVNRITDGNFKNYINGYRIKEAVRIISETNQKELYVDELSERVGFGNRSSFYRAFKQFTGLSPLEFHKNKDLSLSESKF